MLIDSVFEAKTLACLYRSNEFLAVAGPLLEPSLFEGSLHQNMAKIALDYFNTYGSKPTLTVYISELKKAATGGKIKAAEATAYSNEYKTLMEMDLSDWRYVLAEIITFIKHRETKSLIEDAVKRLLPKNDFETINKRWNRIASISDVSQVEPVDYYSDDALENRRLRREDELTKKSKGISTGIKPLDNALPRNGWCPKELYAISGSAKKGKSMSLLWFAHCATLAGKHVVYFSCEMSKEVIEDRLDAMISKTEIRKLPDDIVAVLDSVALNKPSGRLFIYEYPTKTLTTMEVERQMLRLQMEKGIDIGMFITDYAGIMKPSRNLNDVLKEEAGVMEDLRAICYKFQIPGLTGNQNNRGAANKALSSGRDTAGTWEKIAILDGNITLGATDEEIRDGMIRLHLSEMRNAPSKVFKIKTAYNFGLFFKDFIEEEIS